jgi:hypothetical protein
MFDIHAEILVRLGWPLAASILGWLAAVVAMNLDLLLEGWP